MTEYSTHYLDKQRSSASEYASSTSPNLLSPPLSHTNPALLAYRRLAHSIIDFEEKCDNEHEVGVRLLLSKTDVIFHLRDLHYYTPNILNFHGINEHGEALQLVQDVSQLNLLLVSMKAYGDKPFRIGYRLDQSYKR